MPSILLIYTIHSKKSDPLNNITVEIPELKVNHEYLKNNVKTDSVDLDKLRELQEKYYEEIDKKDEENENRPKEDKEYSDLNKVANEVYDDFMSGEITTGSRGDRND